MTNNFWKYCRWNKWPLFTVGLHCLSLRTQSNTQSNTVAVGILFYVAETQALNEHTQAKLHRIYWHEQDGMYNNNSLSFRRYVCRVKRRATFWRWNVKGSTLCSCQITRVGPWSLKAFISHSPASITLPSLLSRWDIIIMKKTSRWGLLATLVI